MEFGDSELKNEMHCAIKFCYHFGKTPQQTVKIMNEAYKDKCFGVPVTFRRHGDLKKRCLSAELVPKLG